MVCILEVAAMACAPWSVVLDSGRATVGAPMMGVWSGFRQYLGSWDYWKAPAPSAGAA
jgi:hypothetical protein